MATAKVVSYGPEVRLTLDYEECVALANALYPVEPGNPFIDDIYDELVDLITYSFGTFTTEVTLGLTPEEAVELQAVLQDDPNDSTDAPFWALTQAIEDAWGADALQCLPAAAYTEDDDGEEEDVAEVIPLFRRRPPVPANKEPDGEAK